MKEQVPGIDRAIGRCRHGGPKVRPFAVDEPLMLSSKFSTIVDLSARSWAMRAV